MLPMLNVTGTPGVVYLNGMFCGETGAAALPLRGQGVQYLEVRPFSPSGTQAVLRLEIADGQLAGGVTGQAFAVQWPDGRIELELRGDETLQTASAPPQLLARLPSDMGEYLFVAEEGVASFGRDAQEAVFLPVASPGDAQLRPLAIPGLCAVTGSCRDGRYAAVLRAQGAPELLACGCGLTAEVDAGGALRCLESVGDFAGHAYLCAYAPTAQGVYRRVSREAAWENGAPRQPRTPEETARAFLEALLNGSAEEAASYLWQPAGAPRLAAAAGAYDAVVSLAPDGSGETALGALRTVNDNIARVRRLVYTARQDATGAFKLATLEEKPCFLAI